MDIFSEFEGLSGENLGSALLRYLIINSHEIRNSILFLLSDNSPIGPISYISHFACRTEYPTFHEEYGDGRLDILIQLDDVVIGIENKFFAQFQNDQPHKYFETLESVAGSLKSINYSEVRTVLYILCPQSRKQEAYEKIKKLKEFRQTSVISWEDILIQLKKIEEISNPVAKTVMIEFMEYIKRQFSFIHDFEKKAIHLKRAFPEFGSSLQRELVGKLWSLFPIPGKRLSNSKMWLGYYFFTDPEINEKGWLGFVPKEIIEYETDNMAELIVVTTYKPALLDGFDEAKIKDDNWIGAAGNTNTWVVKFDKSWNSVDKWRDKLSPLWNALRNDTT